MTLLDKSPATRARKPDAARQPDIDLTTSRRGTPGGIFLRQFWHAVHRGQDLSAGQAKPIRIMGEDYALAAHNRRSLPPVDGWTDVGRNLLFNLHRSPMNIGG